MNFFNVKPETKPRVKRLSDGVFIITHDTGCSLSSDICKRYIDYILFSEASEGSIELK
jgi:hypothetical protein